MCFWSSKELSHLIGPFKCQQHMFWLRNNKTNFPLRTFIWRMGMRSRLTVGQYNNTLSNAFKSMGSHLCTKIIFLGSFLSLQILCGYIPASQTGTDRFFHGDMIIVIRVFFVFILPLLNEIIVFSR